jgi:hypothetical protein
LKAKKRVRKETNISERIFRRILEEYRKHEAEESSFITPGNTHKVSKRVTDIDDFDKCVIRRIIQEEKNVSNYLQTTSVIEGED